eukprot:3533016-Alexandrium_andersonii.AAC.1
MRGDRYVRRRLSRGTRGAPLHAQRPCMERCPSGCGLARACGVLLSGSLLRLPVGIDLPEVRLATADCERRGIPCGRRGAPDTWYGSRKKQPPAPTTSGELLGTSGSP